jgi:hypothetical protein
MNEHRPDAHSPQQHKVSNHTSLQQQQRQQQRQQQLLISGPPP